ncbi:MAG: hypothetical protein AAF441_26230 [Pseudomonadota bacterium]
MSTEPFDVEPKPVPRYVVTSLESRPDLSERHQNFGGGAWPEFMLHDPVAIAHWDSLMAWFPDCQLTLLCGDEILAVINSIPLQFEAPLEELPDRGVDWGVEKSVSDYEAGREPNALLGLQVVVGQKFRSRGVSSSAVQDMISLAAEKRLARVLLPVRPSGKHRYPLIPMEQYAGWSDTSGLPHDGWLRVHARLGGQTVRVCPRSMTIRGSVEDWSRWTGQAFPGSGEYLIPGALNPIDVDVDEDLGVYLEPNVWVVHQVS